METAESQKVEGRLVNLSVHGALTRLVERLPINSPVIVCFDLAVDGKVQRLRIPGTIVHNDSRGTAIEFGSVPEKTNDLLRHFSVYQLVGNR